jgi:hypothetical protein
MEDRQKEARQKEARRRQPRSWPVLIIRSKGEYLGSVEAPDRERAEAAATKQLDLDQEQRGRLLIRERLPAPQRGTLDLKWRRK